MSDTKRIVLTLREVLERLRARKAQQAGVDPAQINVHERVHIEKFDGGRADIEAGLKPSEYIIYESGVARRQPLDKKED